MTNVDPNAVPPVGAGAATGTLAGAATGAAGGAGTPLAAVIATVAVGVVGLGTGAWAITQLVADDPIIVAESASATPTESASPSPSASVDATPELPTFSGQVTVDPQLPSASAITGDAWFAAGDGWVLATYREELSAWDEASGTYVASHGPQAVYLISPEGERFELTSVADESVVRVVAWEPQATTALAILDAGYDEGEQSWVILDLTTGSTRPLAHSDVVGTNWTSATVEDVNVTTAMNWVSPFDEIVGFEPLVALPQAPIAPSTADLNAALATAQQLVDPSQECHDPLALETQVVVPCGETPPGVMENFGEDFWFPSYFVFVDDSGRGSGVAVDVRDPYPDGYTTLEIDEDSRSHGDVVIAMGLDAWPTGCPTGRLVADESGWTSLPGVDFLRSTADYANIFGDAGVVGPNVYTFVSGGCSGDSMSSALVVDNIDTGDFTVLMPFPAGVNDTGSDVFLESALQSAFVVGGRD